MEPQNPASPAETGAGENKPAPGFTFADKRKIDPSGELRQPKPGPSPSQPATGSAAAVAEETPVSGSPSVEDEPDENAKLAAERLADLQRLQAEYANYRKRVARDRDVARDAAIASVVESLLPVLDDLHLARQHGDLESGPFVSIAEKLESTLGRYGVERFGEPGAAFDPSVHDALMHVDAELAEGTDVVTVVGVLQPGYKIGEKVIRPARVSVADPK
jgi:molecular chaperone GrpE